MLRGFKGIGEAKKVKVRFCFLFLLKWDGGEFVLFGSFFFFAKHLETTLFRGQEVQQLEGQDGSAVRSMESISDYDRKGYD